MVREFPLEERIMKRLRLVNPVVAVSELGVYSCWSTVENGKGVK